mgnify:CR=1 FL=1
MRQLGVMFWRAWPPEVAWLRIKFSPNILKSLFSAYAGNRDTLWLLNQVIDSHHPGLPLGNLTSQLFANVYLHELDRFVKQKLMIKNYIRYTDDFVFIFDDRANYGRLLSEISQFLQDRLKLQLHPDKVFLKTLVSGVDFLGWVHFPTHRVLRTSTRRRAEKRIWQSVDEAPLQSYLGLLKHGDGFKISQQLLNAHWAAQSQ